MARFVLLALFLFALSAGVAQARGGDGGGGGGSEVRVSAGCGRGTTASLRLRTDDGRIEMRFRLRQRSRPGLWRIAVVHENRVSTRATRRTTSGDDSFELRRMLPDLPGTDTIVVHAWGPRGAGCRAAATLRS